MTIQAIDLMIFGPTNWIGKIENKLALLAHHLLAIDYPITKTD